MHVATGIMAAAVLIMNPGRWWVRLLCLGAMPFMLNVVIQSESRSAVLAFLAGGLVLWFMKPRSYRKLFYLGAAVGVAVVVFLGHATFWERMSTIETAVQRTEEADSSTVSRVALAKLQLRIAAENPLGIGHRGIVVIAPRYLPPEYLARQGSRSSHNTYLTVLSEQGVPGAVLFAALLLWALRSIWRMRQLRIRAELTRFSGQIAAVAAMLAVAAVGGLAVDYLKAEVQVWGLILVAVLSVEYTMMQAVREPRPAGEQPLEGLQPARWAG
jgi:O-antigen ligase